jgi:folate-dependent phosphoribosylglycinamide formyltransferase PurN/quercetin dioxygenase-like cupin family protein
MIIRKLNDIEGTEKEVLADNKNWCSRRLLLKQDGLGFSFHDTIIYAGTRTLIHYKHHVEAVYCIKGAGELDLIDEGVVIPVKAGTLYVLDKHEKHYLVAKSDMRILCVFKPPLTGLEKHGTDGAYPPDLELSSIKPVIAQGPGPGKLKFAFLNLKGQPRGNYMLNCLIKAGFKPAIVIEENSTLAEKGHDNLTRELKKLGPAVPLPPSLAEIIKGSDIRRFEVANHNNEQCEKILGTLKPDLVVLGDTRIIGSHIIQIPEIGVVNVHPGYLPDVKGNNPYVWAIIHDLPQGCTVHFIDENIDTGPIILRQKINVHTIDSYPHLLAEINHVCGELLQEALYYIRAGMRQGIPQQHFPRETPELGTFSFAPPETKATAIRKLEQMAQDPVK